MSMDLLAWLGHVEAEMGHGEFRVLFRLCWHCNQKTLLCCPSIDELATGAGMSERSVYRAIDALEQNGYIAVVRERWPNGTQKVNRYTILADTTFRMPDGREIRIKATAEEAESRVTPMSPGLEEQPGDTGGAGRVTPMSPNEQGRYNQEVDSPPSPVGDGPPPQPEDLFGEKLPAVAEPKLEDLVLAEWRRLQTEHPMVKGIRQLDHSRITKIGTRARTAQQGEQTAWEVWQEIFLRIRSSRFLCGRKPPDKKHDKPFGLGIDYVLRPAEFLRILEGFYDDRPGDQTAGYDPDTGRRMGPSEQAGRAALERLRSRRTQPGQFGDSGGGRNGHDPGTARNLLPSPAGR